MNPQNLSQSSFKAWCLCLKKAEKVQMWWWTYQTQTRMLWTKIFFCLKWLNIRMIWVDLIIYSLSILPHWLIIWILLEHCLIFENIERRLIFWNDLRMRKINQLCSCTTIQTFWLVSRCLKRKSFKMEKTRLDQFWLIKNWSKLKMILRNLTKMKVWMP